MKRHLAIPVALLLVLSGVTQAMAADRVYRIMPVGDSITQLNLYRYWLWEKLTTAGYSFEFVGSGSTDSRIGRLAHEGHGGKNAEFAASVLAASLQKNPADILLIHGGHNHSYETKPVPGIIAATEKMIADGRASNPKMIVLLAQVITSGKLPKYSYIPELNVELAKLAKRLNTPTQPVVIVDQADGFDPATDTTNDLVHPNTQGAQKMAAKWFEALVTVLEKPTHSFTPKIMSYQQVGTSDLSLHVFTPEASVPAARPAVLVFMGEAWTYGSPLEVYPECTRLAKAGYVAIAVDYRLAYKFKTSPYDSVADARTAVQWVSQHAREIGVDPTKIVVAGVATGAHVATAAAMCPDVDKTGKALTQPLSKPIAAMVLINPALDVSPTGYGYDKMKENYWLISPADNVNAGVPPTFIAMDPVQPLTDATSTAKFQGAIRAAGGTCELVTLPGGLGSYVYPQRNEAQLRVIDDALDFLSKAGITPPAK